MSLAGDAFQRRKPLRTSPSWASYIFCDQMSRKKSQTSLWQPSSSASHELHLSAWLQGLKHPPQLLFWVVAQQAEMAARICKTQARWFCLHIPCAVTVSPGAAWLPYFPHHFSYRSVMLQICCACKSEQGRWNWGVRSTGGRRTRMISISSKFRNISDADPWKHSFKQTSGGKPPEHRTPWYSLAGWEQPSNNNYHVLDEPLKPCVMMIWAGDSWLLFEQLENNDALEPMLSPA